MGHWALGRIYLLFFTPPSPSSPSSPPSPPSPPLPTPHSPLPYLPELPLLLPGLGKVVEFVTFFSPIKMS
ncbi:MAG: hypothetical protein V7K27_02070 [Nostoc sp.]|uniref:hypothetical protein n=1 Tax=Nostoc sp. TaxID=1180 RepID=UPI002FF4DE4D